jgi:anti-sigma B factor antagonist
MLQIRRTAGRDGQAVVSAEGQVDLATAPELAGALAEAQGCGVNGIVVDLTGVDFLDSAGVRVLVEAAREAAAADVALSVRGATGWVARVLEITGVEEYLHVVPHQPAGSGDVDR